MLDHVYITEDEEELEHYEVIEMLEELDNGDFDLSDWEADFVESNMDQDHRKFSDKQLAVILRLRDKHDV